MVPYGDGTGAHVRSASMHPLADLTPQELQVSIMLAEGRTTREAAAALFLSPKTVEYHLRKVYTKLGISSRAELSEQLSHPLGVGQEPSVRALGVDRP